MSSDGVPPELAVLGFQRAPACTGQTGRRNRSDRSAQGFAGVDRFDDRSRVLAHSSVLAQFCVNRLIADLWLTCVLLLILLYCDLQAESTSATNESVLMVALD